MPSSLASALAKAILEAHARRVAEEGSASSNLAGVNPHFEKGTTPAEERRRALVVVEGGRK